MIANPAGRRGVRLAAVAAALGLLAANPSWAFIRATVGGVNNATDPNDTTPIRWDLLETQMPLASVAGGEVIFVIDTAGFSGIPTTEENAAVVRAFQHWEGIGTSRAAFARGTDQAIQAANNDGINAVYWAEGSRTQIGGSNVNVTGFVSMTPVFAITTGANKGLIQDANIILNGRQFVWSVHPETDPANYDVEGIVTHEIGHFLGLDHSGVLGSAMSPRFVSGEARSRMLELDDQIGASEIYPDGHYGIGTGAIAGSIGRPAAVFGALVTTTDSVGRVICESVTAANGAYSSPGLGADTYQVYVEPIDPVPPTTTNLFDETDLGGVYGPNMDPNFSATLTLAASVTPPATTPGVSFLVGSTQPLINITKIGGRANTLPAVQFFNAPTYVFQGDTNILIGVAGPNVDEFATFEITGTGFTDNGVVSTGSTLDGEPYIIKSFTVAANAPVGLRSMRVSRGALGRTYATGAVEVYPNLSMSLTAPGVFGVVPGEVNPGRVAGQNPVELWSRGNDLDLQWDDEPGAYGYHVYRGTLASLALGTYDHQMIGGNPNGACAVTGSYVALKDELLDPVDRYYLITAWNNAGEGITGRNSANGVLPPAAPACPAP